MSNGRTLLLLSCFALFVTSGVARPVYAQDPCEADRAKYCPGFRADDPRRLYCLKSIQSQVKPSCKSSLQNVPGTESEFIDECSDDYHKLCADVQQGKGRILKCLQANSKKLNFECRKKVSAFPIPK